jgi:hypothetical protein
MPLSQDIGLEILEQLKLLNINNAHKQTAPMLSVGTYLSVTTTNLDHLPYQAKLVIFKLMLNPRKAWPTWTTRQLLIRDYIQFPLTQPGVPSNTLESALCGEFIELHDFYPSLGTSYTSATSELEPYLENNNVIHYSPKRYNRKVINLVDGQVFGN